MKKLLLFINITISLNLVSQGSAKIERELYKLPFNQSIAIENKRLEFKALSPDSRCPKEVLCNRAGEVFATIYVFDNNLLETELVLKFYPSTAVEELTELLKNENILIRNLELWPYPKATKPQIKSDYFIQFERILVN